jgi:hypothetical protein
VEIQLLEKENRCMLNLPTKKVKMMLGGLRNMKQFISESLSTTVQFAKEQAR